MQTKMPVKRSWYQFGNITRLELSWGWEQQFRWGVPILEIGLPIHPLKTEVPISVPVSGSPATLLLPALVTNTCFGLNTCALTRLKLLPGSEMTSPRPSPCL